MARLTSALSTVSKSYRKSCATLRAGLVGAMTLITPASSPARAAIPRARRSTPPPLPGAHRRPVALSGPAAGTLPRRSLLSQPCERLPRRVLPRRSSGRAAHGQFRCDRLFRGRADVDVRAALTESAHFYRLLRLLLCNLRKNIWPLFCYPQQRQGRATGFAPSLFPILYRAQTDTH